MRVLGTHSALSVRLFFFLVPYKPLTEEPVHRLLDKLLLKSHSIQSLHGSVRESHFKIETLICIQGIFSIFKTEFW